MHARNRRRLDMPQSFERRSRFGHLSRRQIEQNVVRHRCDACIGFYLAAVLENRACEAVALHAQSAHSAAHSHFTPALRNGLPATFVQFRQRHRRNSNSISKRVAQKTLPENFNPVLRVRSRQFFIERAYQHYAPEPLDRSSGLAHRVQPVQHRRALRVRRLPSCACNCQHRPRNRTFIHQGQRVEQQKRRRHVQRRRQRRSLNFRTPSLAIDKIKPVVKPDLLARSHAPVKIGQVRAATQRHVLAIVHFAAVGQRVRRSAPAEVGTLLEQLNAKTCVSQRDGGGQARQAAADYQDALRGHHPSTNRPSSPPGLLRGDIELFRRSIVKRAK